MKNCHKWPRDDDELAFYVERHGLSSLPVASLNEISLVFGMSVSSFQQRMANFRSLDGRGGLSHAAKQSRAVYDELKRLPEAAVRAKVIQTLLARKKRK